MNKGIIEGLSKSLKPEEIELRVGITAPERGFSLLAYKTARTDINRLNDVCGLGWKNRFFYDDKGLLVCEISVYDNELQQWITRTDVGVESYTEKEKGSYSDARKRAGFAFGIGIELYNYPFIWIASTKWKKDKKGKNIPDEFFKGWVVKYADDVDYKSGILIYDDKGNLRWSNKKYSGTNNKKTTPEKEATIPKPETEQSKEPEISSKIQDMKKHIIDGIAYLKLTKEDETILMQKYSKWNSLSKIWDESELALIMTELQQKYRELKK